MSVLDKAQAHYRQLLATEAKPINIKEWDTQCFIRPSMSLQKLGEIMGCSTNGNPAEAMALTVIYRLVDEEGKAIFKKSDKLELLKSVSPDVLTDIVTTINESDPSAEEVEGN